MAAFDEETRCKLLAQKAQFDRDELLVLRDVLESELVALRLAVRGLGDAICAIVGGIVVAAAGIDPIPAA